MTLPASFDKSSQTGRRSNRAAAIDDIVNLFRERLEDIAAPGTTDLNFVRSLLSGEDRTTSSGTNELIRQVSSGHTYSTPEQAALEMATRKDAFDRRNELLLGSLSAPQVAVLLGTTRQTPHDRAARGTLLAVKHKGRLCFPSWQFDPEGPGGVVNGFQDVLRDLAVSDLAKVSWLTQANPVLDGKTPLQFLAEGKVNRVRALARSVGTS